METITVQFTAEKWEAIRNHLELTENVDYTIINTVTPAPCS